MDLAPQNDERTLTHTRTGSVYRITCAATGKSYVGQTRVNVRRRFLQHLATKTETPLATAIREFGAAAFSCEVLEEFVPTDRLDECERYWINWYATIVPDGLNANGGGSTHQPVSRATRQKLSEAMRGRPKATEWRARMSALAKGRKLSPETRTRMSEAKRGRTYTDEARAKLSAAVRAYRANHAHPMPFTKKGKA